MSDEALAYGIADISRVAPIGRTRIYELIRAGELKAVKCGRRTMVTRRELERFLSQLEADTDR